MLNSDFYKGKRILITGHTGFKGTWMCQVLLELGADVTGYALQPPTNPSLFEMTGMEGKLRSVEGDVRDLQHLQETFEQVQPEIVIHMAAQPIVRESYKNPIYTYDVNVMGTVNVMECVRRSQSVRSVVNVTTDKVYRNREWEWGYRENEELNGFDPYSNSKSCSELVTECYKNSFLNAGKDCCIHCEGRECYRRGRFCDGSHPAGLFSGCFRGEGDCCAESLFYSTLSACAGAGFCLSSDSRKAIRG